MRILIVEDELNMASAIVSGLKQTNISKYTIDVAYDGLEALDLFFEYEYELIVLDLNLPSLDGMQVLKEIRIDNEKVPILILSARANVEEKVKGLNLGANDYLAKPFDFSELHARINALLRFTKNKSSEIIKIHSIYVDTNLRNIYGDNGLVFNLTQKEIDILCFLVDHSGVIFSEAELVQKIWDKEIDNTSVIRVHINNIRNKLSDKEIIKTIKGRGYYVEKME